MNRQLSRTAEIRWNVMGEDYKFNITLHCYNIAGGLVPQGVFINTSCMHNMEYVDAIASLITECLKHSVSLLVISKLLNRVLNPAGFQTIDKSVRTSLSSYIGDVLIELYRDLTEEDTNKGGAGQYV